MPVSFSDAERAVRERLGKKARHHSERVADTAGTLARVYGVDPDPARLAGLLHDWDRELGDEELMARARELGVAPTGAELAVPYLLHARTAAADLRATFPGLPDEIVCAVEHHTMGAVEMSDLDMVVYIADMIEPHRSYPGVDDLRAAVGAVPLRELYVRCYAHTIRSLADRRRPIHPKTVEIWNALIAEGRDG